MTNHIIKSADALLAQLNALTLSQDFTATRRFRVDDLYSNITAGLNVYVVPAGRTIARETRGVVGQRLTHQVAVAVGFTSEPENSVVDPYAQLTDEIIDAVEAAPQLTWSGGSASLVEVVQAPIWSRQHLEELNAYLSILTLTYLGQF